MRIDEQAAAMTPAPDVPAPEGAGLTIATGDAVTGAINEFGRPSEVRPDNEPVAADTNDQTIRCKTCKNDLVVPQTQINAMRDDPNVKLACPSCHTDWSFDGWELSR
jgi:hypothetical protein